MQVRAAAATSVEQVRSAAGAASSAVEAGASSAKDAIGAAADAVEGAVTAAAPYVEQAQELAERAAPVVKQGAEAAAPYVKQAGDLLQPYAEQVGPGAAKLAEGAGVDLQRVAAAGEQAVGAVTQGVDAAAPLVAAAAAWAGAQDPETLTRYGLGALGVYVLSPVVLGVLADLSRGYKGNVSAVEALTMTSDGALLVDVRDDAEKQRAGVPELAKARNYVAVEPPETPAGVKGKLQNARETEAKVTALLVGSLKRVGRGTTVLLMDGGGGKSKLVAKAMTAAGFGRVYVVARGFGGWKAARLNVQVSKSVKNVQVLPPAAAPKGLLGSGRGTTSGKTITVSGRTVGGGKTTGQKFLPGRR